MKEQDVGLSLLHGACITVLQHTAILVCLKSTNIKEKTVRIVTGLFMKIIKCAYLENTGAFCKSVLEPINFKFCIQDKRSKSTVLAEIHIFASNFSTGKLEIKFED